MTIWSGFIEIDAPPSEVFDFVIDRRNYHRWFPGIVRMEPTDQLPPLSPSKTYREVAMGPDNVPKEIGCKTLCVMPKSFFRMQADLWPIRPFFEYGFTDNGSGGTKFAFAASRGSYNPLAFVGSVIMRKVLAKRGPEALLRLKTIVEDEPAQSMQAAEFREFGSPQTVVALNAAAPRPSPQAGQVLIKVSSASINPIEPKRVTGYGAAMLRFKSGTDWPITLGADFAGKIEAVGEGMTGFVVGDAVFGVKDVNSRGTHAQFTLVNTENVRLIPSDVDPTMAAALPYAWSTVWAALVTDCGIDKYQGSLLVRGGSGGAGMAAIMLAKSLGWQVDAACKADARELVKGFGASEVFAYDRDEKWPEGRYDIVLDCVGDPHFAKIKSTLSDTGPGIYSTLVHPTLALGDAYGALAGLLKAKRLRRKQARETSLDIRFPVFAFSADALEHLRGWLPVFAPNIAIDTEFALSDIVQAYTYVEAGGLRGKVMIRIADADG